MSKGVCVFAQNNGTVDYVQQAVYLAKSLRVTNSLPVTLITDTPYKHSVFDRVVLLDDDDAKHNEWKIQNRYKVYDLSPYEQTLVFDADCVVLSDITRIFNLLQQDLFFTHCALTYTGDTVSSDTYRKTFTANNLPNVYTGFYYFRKSCVAEKFFRLQKIIFENHTEFYNIFCKHNPPLQMSMDVNAAIGCKLFNIQLPAQICKFVHMKPAVQNWNNIPHKWTEQCDFFLTKDLKLSINNYVQSEIFHYVEPEFLNNRIKNMIDRVYDEKFSN